MTLISCCSAMSSSQFMQRSDSRNHLPTSDSRQRLPQVETQRSISMGLSMVMPSSSIAREPTARYHAHGAAHLNRW